MAYLASPSASTPQAAEALALRVAELSSVLKQQRDELEEKDTLLEHNRKLVREHEEIIRMQESQLLERDAQLQSQNAEIRALRRQHTMDAEALRAAQQQLQGRIRPSGSMGVPLGAQQRRRQERSGLASTTSSPGKMSEAESAAPGSPTSPGKKPTTPNSTRKQLQQAIADKVSSRFALCPIAPAHTRSPFHNQAVPTPATPVDASAHTCAQVVLVRALHQLTAEMAQARAEARKYAAVSERSLSTAWRLGQLGQLGLALLEVGDDGGQVAGALGAIEPDDGAIDLSDEAMSGERRWEALMNATEASAPLAGRLLPAVDAGM